MSPDRRDARFCLVPTCRRSAVTLLAAASIIAASGMLALAHKPITSKYTYNTDLFPIFRDRCGACHTPGGVAPMSLLTYGEAFPWAQSIKEEVISLNMPPWPAEERVGAFKNAHVLTARELDVILDWTSGGTPEGDADRRPPEPAPPPETWPLGDPDLTLAMGKEHVLDEDAMEDERCFVIPTGLTADRFIRAIDVRPGSRAMVRSVLVYADTSGKARARDEADAAPGFPADDEPGFPTGAILAAWLPGQQRMTLSGDAGYRLPARADLVLRVRYKKTWTYEGRALSDRTTVGVYFTTAPRPTQVRTVVVASGATDAAAGAVTFSHTLDRAAEVIALLPQVGGPDTSVEVSALRPDGTETPLLRVGPRAHAWPRRYWLETPAALPKGSRIQVKAAPAADPAYAVTRSGGGQGRVVAPIRVMLDLVSTDRRTAAAHGPRRPK